MNQRKARAQRKGAPPKNGGGNGKGPEVPTEAISAALEAPDGGEEPQPVTYPSILVVRVPGEQPGQERIEIAELNGIDALAVPTVLRLAATIKENQLGISERR